MIHKIDKYFLSPTHPITITLIGCGGTGSFLLPKLARLDLALQRLHHPGLFVTAYDGDIVEEHNVGRQNFTFGDIGKNKAITLIEKVNFCYGLNWVAIPNLVMDEIVQSNLFISCVDNAAFRMQLASSLNNVLDSFEDYKESYYWLDTGNGRDFGQVVLGTINDIEQSESEVKTLSKLKNVVDIYGDLTSHDTEEKQQTRGCSYREKLMEQDLTINDKIATTAFDLLWSLFKDMKVESNHIIVNKNRVVPVPFRGVG